MPKKNYVFDTNVLIHDPKSIFRFQDNDIYIPIYVLEELDGLKNDQGQRGFSAREAIRIIDDLRVAGSLKDGIVIHKNSEFLPEGMSSESSGKLYVYAPNKKPDLSCGLSNIVDNAILQSALNIKESFCTDSSPSLDKRYSSRTILVTMDINLRVRAESMGLQVAQYEFQSVDISTLKNEIKEVSVTKDFLDEIYKSGIVYVRDLGLKEDDFEMNSSVMVKALNTNTTALCRVKEDSAEKILKKIEIPRHILGLKPRNAEQNFALDLLLDEDVKLVTIMGKAGCGKTILTLAAGLYQVIDKPLYSKILISRPVMPVGRDLGFLPGTLEEKLNPWMQPFYDNLDYIMMSSGNKSEYGNIDNMVSNGVIQIEPLMSIRGRSIPNQFIIIDEAQNLTPHEVKTIITRCGENTKIVLTGDVYQIDNPYISSSSNGLSVAAKKLRDNHMAGHIALQKGERSALATLAADEL